MTLRALRPLAAFAAASIAALLQASDPPRLAGTPQMQDEARLVVRLVEDVHYAGRPIREAEAREFLLRFIESLDGRKLFLTQPEVDATLDRNAPRLPDQLRYFGSLDAAYAIYARFREVAAARFSWISTRLDQPFDLTTDEAFVFDRRKLPWPADDAEADRLWDQRLRAEILESLLEEMSLDEAREVVRKRYDRLARNFEDIESEDIQELFLTSLMQVYDPHSNFLSAQTAEDFQISLRLQLIGIGALLGQEEGTCTIRELVPGGPAQRSGELNPGDQVLAVAQDQAEPIEVSGMKLRKIVNMIRGERGTRVALTILPATAGATGEKRIVTLERDVIHLDESRARASIRDVPDGDATRRVGVISIPSFYGGDAADGSGNRVSVTTDVRELLDRLGETGIDALVLDMRRNGGGLLSEAVDLAGLFIPRGPVVQVRDSRNRIMVRSDTESAVAYSGPLVVLTDRFTASAAEIVAGALQNYSRAIVVGDSSTHGKGSVQQIYDLREFLSRGFDTPVRAGAAKVTVQKFYLPSGASTQNAGVVPDIILPSIEDFLPIGEKDLPHALAWDEIPSARFNPLNAVATAVDDIRARSASRRSELPDFAYLDDVVSTFRDRAARKSVSLNLDERRSSRSAEKALDEALEQEARSLAANDYPSTPILLAGQPAETSQASATVANPPPGASVTPQTPASPDGSTPAAEPKEDPANIDVALREGLRVAVDLANLSLGSSSPDTARHPAMTVAGVPSEAR